MIKTLVEALGKTLPNAERRVAGILRETVDYLKDRVDGSGIFGKEKPASTVYASPL